MYSMSSNTFTIISVIYVAYFYILTFFSDLLANCTQNSARNSYYKSANLTFPDTYPSKIDRRKGIIQAFLFLFLTFVLLLCTLLLLMHAIFPKKHCKCIAHALL